MDLAPGGWEPNQLVRRTSHSPLPGKPGGDLSRLVCIQARTVWLRCAAVPLDAVLPPSRDLAAPARKPRLRGPSRGTAVVPFSLRPCGRRLDSVCGMLPRSGTGALAQGCIYAISMEPLIE